MTSGCSRAFSPPPPIPPRHPPSLPPRTYHKHSPAILSRHQSPSLVAPRPKRHLRHSAVVPISALPATPSLPVLVSAEVHPVNENFLPQLSSYSSPDMHLLTFPYKSAAANSSNKQSTITAQIRPATSWQSQGSSKAVPNIYVFTEIQKLPSPKQEELQESEAYPPPPPPPSLSLPPMKVSPNAIFSRRRKKLTKHSFTLAWLLITVLFVLGVAVVVIPVSVIITKHL